MIYDTIERAGWYRGISPQLDKALEILETVDFSALDPGRYEVEEDVFYNVMELELHSWENTLWEHHKLYLDVQCTLEEGEQVAVCPIERLRDWSEYDEKGDGAVTKEDADGLILPMGRKFFAIFFPGDAHRTGWAVEKSKKVKKVVIKAAVGKR